MTGKRILMLLVLLVLGSAAVSVMAARSIKVMALFSGKAMVEVDGVRRFLRQGERSEEGVLLISATAREAVIEADGEENSYGLGSQFGGTFAKREITEVQIARSSSGSFITTGSINGRLTRMMVDTGATLIAMSETEAKRLGIQYRLDGEKTAVHTASGQAGAYALTLDKVQVGEVVLNQVEAVVVEGGSPQMVLLGMSFLKRLEIENRGEMLVIRQKF